jgi:hypothetical protein
MPIPPDEVQHIAAPAKLKLNPEGLSHLSHVHSHIRENSDLFREIDVNCIVYRAMSFNPKGFEQGL